VKATFGSSSFVEENFRSEKSGVAGVTGVQELQKEDAGIESNAH
jgi:hypothetical protein